MEKILLVINARNPKITTIEFACKIAEDAQTSLTGLFIENIYASPVSVSFPEGPSYFETIKEQKQLKTDTALATRIFQDECRMRNVRSEVYIDKGEPIQETIYESRFADLLICDPDAGFYELSEQMPSHFVKEILTNSECPVVLAPSHFGQVQEVYFCYDGSNSSVYAMKQFTYLFPEFRDKKVTLLEVSDKTKAGIDENEQRMMNWLRAHYTTVTYHSLEGDTKEELSLFLFMQQNKFVVMGAFGRSALSNFFKKSSAANIIRLIDLPIFITHHKK